MAGLTAPRFESKPAMLIAGISKRYTADGLNLIPNHWYELQSRLGLLSGSVGGDAFGLWYGLLNGGGQFTYLAGLSMGEFAPIHPDFSRARIAPLHYAVFVHQGPYLELRSTVNAILTQWLPTSGQEMAAVEGRPDVIERYTERFNETGDGPIELWVPIQKK